MSLSVLRQANRSLCYACLRFRFYASQALAQAPPAIHLRSRDHETQSATAYSPESLPAIASTVRKRSKTTKSSSVSVKDPLKSSKSKPGAQASRESQLNPLDPNKVDLYLASIHAAGLEPSLEDIERCRPPKHAHPDSPQYARDYNALIDTLCRSFSKEQLRRFGDLYGLDPVWTRSTRRKVEYAESIIEKQWQWPSLKEIERQKRDRTEVSVKPFNVNPSQLFLILGNDGVNLLQLSLEFNVHISLTANPLALRVEGLRGSIKGITERIAALKKGIIEETIELPTKSPIKQDMVQRISRLAGAFVENVGYRGKVRICAKDARNLLNAKRLATRAACEVQVSSSPLLLAHLPAATPSTTPVPTLLFPHSYALYPFFTPHALPWTMHTGGAFRVRRVAEWLGADPSEDIARTGGLRSGKGRVVTCSQEDRDLKEVLFGAMPELMDTTRVVTASLGHLLLTSPTAAQRASIVPPFKGQSPLPKILGWLEKGETKNAFVPSLPMQLLHSQPAGQRILHRLIYNIFSTESEEASSGALRTKKVIKFEVVLSQAKPSTGQHEQKMDDGEMDRDGTFWEADGDDEMAVAGKNSAELELEELERAFKHEADESQDSGAAVLDESDDTLPVLAPGGPTSTEMLSQCQIGVESALDLMLPDRSMDIRFSVFDSSLIPDGNQPPELQSYLSGLRAFLEYRDPEATQPDPPLSFNYGGETYILHTSASVRQGTESAAGSYNDIATHILSESVFDLESNQKSTECQVHCSEPASAESWGVFLGHCDRLTETVRGGRFRVKNRADDMMDEVS